jgi:hypothetical protein
MALLAKIQDGKHKQAERGYAQQGRLQAVEEARFHGRTLLDHLNLLLTTHCCTSVAMRENARVTTITMGNRLRIREIGTQGSVKRQPEFPECPETMQELVGDIRRKGLVYGNQ